jgi:hypothetical protein
VGDGSCGGTCVCIPPSLNAHACIGIYAEGGTRRPKGSAEPLPVVLAAGQHDGVPLLRQRA